MKNCGQLNCEFKNFVIEATYIAAFRSEEVAVCMRERKHKYMSCKKILQNKGNEILFFCRNNFFSALFTLS